MPAPVRIGSTSIVSSRSSIRTATNQTVTVTRLVRMPPSVLARRCHSRSGWRPTPRELLLQVLDRQVRGADDDQRADDDDDDVDAVGERPVRPSAAGSSRGSVMPNRARPNETLADGGDTERQQPERTDQPRGPLVQRLAALRADRLHRGPGPGAPSVRRGHDDGGDAERERRWREMVRT